MKIAALTCLSKSLPLIAYAGVGGSSLCACQFDLFFSHDYDCTDLYIGSRDLTGDPALPKIVCT
jgi:hypothetical protein